MREAEEMVIFHHFCSIEYARSCKPTKRYCSILVYIQYRVLLLATIAVNKFDFDVTLSTKLVVAELKVRNRD